MNKVCIDCKNEKTIELFELHSNGNYRSQCKDCFKIRQKIKSEKRNFPAKQEGNKTCSVCLISQTVKNFNKNKRHSDGLVTHCNDCRSNKNKIRYEAKKQQIKETTREYYHNNKEKHRVYKRKRSKERRLSDPMYKLRRNLRNRLYYALSYTSWKKNTKFSEYIGCSLDELKKHIESKFQPGMTWENHGQWEIDHIYPLSLAKSEQELYKLCHYSNLQPMWQSENRAKSNKILATT